ncbi:hypothetical protein LJY18_03000 [Pseudomonas sp. MMS21-TM103]|uniref:hypothetical protein n=1 Tax=Pseudomonas sp. MMS21 TM103 TaxID=2886506 RepID=UPI001EDE1790|nr:hypothetical protein [Pseudomonas sp. MMS21 TM103]MCG4452270.1 hypothetical protein [Pseudomonas sp. MMS21 TM103]
MIKKTYPAGSNNDGDELHAWLWPSGLGKRKWRAQPQLLSSWPFSQAMRKLIAGQQVISRKPCQLACGEIIYSRMRSPGGRINQLRQALGASGQRLFNGGSQVCVIYKGNLP